MVTKTNYLSDKHEIIYIKKYFNIR